MASAPSDQQSGPRVVEISYSFNVPKGTASPTSLKSAATSESAGTYSFRVRDDPSAGNAAYYEGLLAALKEAKTVTGEDLTAWRDAVGDAEKTKEVLVKKPVNDDEEEEEAEVQE